MKWLLRIVGGMVLVAAVLLGARAVQGWLSRPPAVAVTDVVRADVVRTLAVTGRVRAREAVQIVPLRNGRLIDLLVDEGDAVRSGQIVARIDSEAERAEIERLQAALAGNLAQLEQAQRDVDRTNRLFREELVARELVEQDQLEVERLQRERDQIDRQLATARVRAGELVLRSPLDGWVLERPVDPGQVVGPNDTVFRLATGEAAEIEVPVDELYLGELRVGMAATVGLLRGDAPPMAAEIRQMPRSVDRSSGAGLVILDFVGEAPDLPIGLSLDVNLEVAEHPGALVVPRDAVVGVGSQPAVLRLFETPAVEGEEPEQRLERVDVEVIEWPSERLVVREGLNEGDLIAVDPRSAATGVPVRADASDQLPGAGPASGD